MKNRKKISSLLVVLAMFLQMIAGPFFGTVFAADNPQGQTVQIVPELSDGITVDASQLDQLVVKGTLCNGVFTYTESKTLTFTATLGDGWSFHSNYSSFFPSDSSHTSIQNNGSTVDFTYHVTQGQTVDFTDLQNVLLNATAAELPKLEITTGVPFGSITKETWVDANFQLTLGTKSFNSGNYTGTGSVKGRGNSSWLNPQKSYSLKLSQKESLLDIPKTKKYAIVAGYSDPSLMRNYITYKSGLKLQGIDYTPKCEFVKVYLNGTYNGIYILVERIDIESTKIDIEEATEENITGGYIIEKDAGDKVNKAVDPWFNAPFQANPNEDLFTVKAPDPVTDEMLTYLEEHMQKLNDALTGVSQEDYTKYIDSASWADFLIMQELSKNIDGNLKTSCYFYKEKDNDLVRMTALWDFDLAYGIANWDNKSDNNDRWDCPSGTGTSDFMVINSSCPWFKTLYAKPEFAALVKQRYTEYRYTLIPEMLKLINQQGAYLNSSVNGAPYTGSYQFTSGVSSLKSWLNGRISWLDNQWFLSPSVTVTPETSDVNPGNTQAFTANVENIPDTSVLWSVSGNTSAQTVIDPTGTLTVGSDEAASSLTVTATSLAASAASGSATIQVTTSSSSSNLAQGATILGKNRNTFNGEEIEKAFDGDEATKWCAEQTPSWVVFDIKTAAEVNRLRVVHASGSLIPEDERYNTVDFSLQVLDAEKLTETDFLAMDASQQQNVMADDSYWTNLKSYTGNSLGLTDDTFSPMGVRRIYRLNVTHADNNWWGGKDTVRIFEIQLFGNGEAPTKYPIHIESMNNGAVTADKATAEKDETVNLTVIPENGYRLVEGSLKANNMVIENASFMMPAEAVTITAQFEKIPAPKYNIHINEMENGTVTSDKQTAEEGETVQLMIAPVEGYQLAESSLKVNGVAVEGTSFTMPAEDVTIDAVFEVIPPVKYQILIDSPVNGTITADKQTAAEGETVTLTVTPDDGYRLVEGSLKAN
ncbi:MAG: hypothetical protein HFE39_05450, partial [Clostridiales bacterium]|nr:hypothetical protein [Clostridiales bacterium]